MKINFIVEDKGPLKYLGCATAAKNLFNALKKKIDISYNDPSYEYDLCHFHTFGPKSIMYLKRFKGKSVITAHSTPNLNDGNLAFPRLVNWLYVPIYNQFNYIISVSKKCERELHEIGCKPPISTIYNGIDIDKFKPDSNKRKRFRELYNISEDSLVVLTVAQRTPRKGVYDFLKLARQFPEYTFIWIGGFPYYLFSKEYRKVIQAINTHPTNTLFPGFVEDIFEVYSAADVFFMPSYAEGHSIVMLEALSMKLPMIARDLEEFREAFDDMLLYFSNVQDIKKEMFSKKTLTMYKKKAEQIKKYQIDKIADEHIALYEKILND
jgi:1,2-diacylglycerol-3-alpha-glucose alpha-1,2-galactosyltransferase